VVGVVVDRGSNGAPPGVGAESVDVFLLGEVDGLEQGLSEVSESGSGFGF